MRLLRQPVRWARTAAVALFTTVLTAGVLVFPMSGSASAAGYPITYTVANSTGQLLRFKDARVGIGGHCKVNLSVGLVVCDPAKGNGRDFAGNVGPLVVTPGGSISINYELDVLNFTVPEGFLVTYTINSGGFVRIHESRTTVSCVVEGSKSVACQQTGLRDFRLVNV